MSGDTYSNYFYNKETKERLFFPGHEYGYINEGEILQLEGKKYRVIHVYSSDDGYIDPYDEHSVDRHYVNEVTVSEIE